MAVMNPEQKTIESLLTLVRQRFYIDARQSFFFRDRKMLAYAMTWPAKWMSENSLNCSQKQYGGLIEERLEQIALHGNPEAWEQYFPRYLLKCLQDHFQYNFDKLYYELKRIGSALEMLAFSGDEQARESFRAVEAMARAHTLLSSQYRSKRRSKEDPSQMTLF